ncbi:hypothetical protein CAPTEDRAFT_188295 [Capitella teleta]|uniref:G-protein coupled receptors family 1 profile domain-containing protein n=1 Tax=Capitella teleta TaxID=283909 RepID=R7TWC7_CAPTE|nr:hypothetical protein CAPTEDRAFT_188295 [Capitella teleta]|eukprot:ELT97882.1 hypothetical protein CAPTEDRAFT_188295 [Capitella teleta]
MASTGNEAVARGCQATLLALAMLGLITNTLSLITLCGRRMRQQSSSVGLMTLAIADIAVLLLATIRYHAYYLFLNDDQFLNVKLSIEAYLEVYVEPVYWMALGISSAVTVAVTTQRFIVIRFPFLVRRHASQALAVAGLVIVVLIPVALTLPHFFYYKVITVDFLGISVRVIVLTDFGKTDAYRCVYLQYLLPILFYIVPWFHLAVTNTLLGHHVRASAARVASTVGAPTDHGRHLTRLLVILSAVFMLLHLPKCVILFVRLVDGSGSCTAGSDGTVGSPESAIEVADWIATVLNVANSAVNFFLYCVFGERFRKEFAAKFLGCRCTRHVQIHVQTSVKTLTTSAANNATMEP